MQRNELAQPTTVAQEFDLLRDAQTLGGALKQAVSQDRTISDAWRLAHSIALLARSYDDPNAVALKMHQLAPLVPSGDHKHGVLFAEGPTRMGKLATVSIVKPNSNEKPVLHDHPEDTIEFTILISGQLMAIEEGTEDKPLRLFEATPSEGKHSVYNPGDTPAVYMCLRFKLANEESSIKAA